MATQEVWRARKSTETLREADLGKGCPKLETHLCRNACEWEIRGEHCSGGLGTLKSSHTWSILKAQRTGRKAPHSLSGQGSQGEKPV